MTAGVQLVYQFEDGFEFCVRFQELFDLDVRAVLRHLIERHGRATIVPLAAGLIAVI